MLRNSINVLHALVKLQVNYNIIVEGDLQNAHIAILDSIVTESLATYVIYITSINFCYETSRVSTQ